jgi:hypothetical protein
VTKNYTSRLIDSDGTLACECWCTATIQHVPAVDVRKGITSSCGVECYRGCKPCPVPDDGRKRQRLSYTAKKKSAVVDRLRPR